MECLLNGLGIKLINKSYSMMTHGRTISSDTEGVMEDNITNPLQTSMSLNLKEKCTSLVECLHL